MTIYNYNAAPKGPTTVPSRIAQEATRRNWPMNINSPGLHGLNNRQITRIPADRQFYRLRGL